MQTLSSSSNKPLFPKGPSLVVPTVLLCLLSAALLLADARSSALADVRQVVAAALDPVVWVAQLPTRIGRIGTVIVDQRALIDDHRRLREQLLRQEARLRRLAALEAENARLRELLSSSRRLDEEVLVGEILSISQDPYQHQIVINRGSRDGVYRGQAIVDAYGVLGQVVRVHPRSSVAMLIPNHSIPVEVNRSGLQTIARGRGEGGGLSLPFLPGNADIRVGDLLVSSALGGRFPAGYPVAEVVEVRYQAGEHFMQAIAYPSARTLRGRQVLLVWSERPPAETDDEAPPP